MRNCTFLCAAALALGLAGHASTVSAQTFENVGVRAQGMGGAFVAVADDATASWWNPAGLASGAYLSALLERSRVTEPSSPVAGGPAIRATSGDFAIAFPALGLSYYRFRISEIAPFGSTASWAANRQDPRTSGSSVRSVSVNQFGTTIGQSIGDHLVIGSTIKLLVAGATVLTPPLSAAAPSLDDVDGLSVSRHYRSDLDVGAMAQLGHVRVGFTAKNLTRPTLGSGADALTLERQARVGLAVFTRRVGGLQGWKLAADADLTTQATVTGNVRHVAGGAEAWLLNGRLGVRGGLSGNTVDDLRPAVSGGVSVAVTRAIHVNATRTQGRDESVQGWSTGVSVTF